MHNAMSCCAIDAEFDYMLCRVSYIHEQIQSTGDGVVVVFAKYGFWSFGRICTPASAAGCSFRHEEQVTLSA